MTDCTNYNRMAGSKKKGQYIDTQDIGPREIGPHGHGEEDVGAQGIGPQKMDHVIGERDSGDRHRTGHGELIELDEIAARFCQGCGVIAWERDGAMLEDDQGVALACGDFHVIGSMDAVGAPARQVLITKPTTKTGQDLVNALPTGVWLRAMPALWVSPGDKVLLMATANRPAIAG